MAALKIRSSFKMLNRFIGSILVMVAALAISLAMFAQTAAQSGATKAQGTIPTPDLSGVWAAGSVAIDHDTL